MWWWISIQRYMIIVWRQWSPMSMAELEMTAISQGRLSVWNTVRLLLNKDGDEKSNSIVHSNTYFPKVSIVKYGVEIARWVQPCSLTCLHHLSTQLIGQKREREICAVNVLNLEHDIQLPSDISRVSDCLVIMFFFLPKAYVRAWRKTNKGQHFRPIGDTGS